MPEESASIPDNWLCISDWQITHQLVFGRGKKKTERKCSRFTFHCTWKNTRHDNPVRCQSKTSVYTETKTDSHTTVHTKTHTPTFIEAAYKVLLFLSPAFWTWVSLGKASTQVTLPHGSVRTLLFSANYSSLSHYWPHFSVMLGQTRMSLLTFGTTTLTHLTWPAGELCITHMLKLVISLHTIFFVLFCLTSVIITGIPKIKKDDFFKKNYCGRET